MNRDEVFARAVSPRTAQDPLFVRDSIGVSLFGHAEQIAAERRAQTFPVSGMPQLQGGFPPPPNTSAPPPPPQAIPSPLTVRPNDIIQSLPDTGPTLDDFTRHGTLPGFGDAAQDPFGSALRRRLTVLLRSS